MMGGAGIGGGGTVDELRVSIMPKWGVYVWHEVST